MSNSHSKFLLNSPQLSGAAPNRDDVVADANASKVILLGVYDGSDAHGCYHMSQDEFAAYCVPAHHQHKLPAWWQFGNIFAPTVQISILEKTNLVFAMKAIESAVEYLRSQGMLNESKNRNSKTEFRSTGPWLRFFIPYCDSLGEFHNLLYWI
jgi:hypothetical protein